MTRPVPWTKGLAIAACEGCGKRVVQNTLGPGEEGASWCVRCVKSGPPKPVPKAPAVPVAAQGSLWDAEDAAS